MKMSYIQGIDRDQTMLLPAAVQDYVAEDNPVRAVDAFVDSLDLEQIGFALRADDDVGRPGYHPATLLKLYLWGYLSQTRSSRRLEEACAANLNAIWLTQNLRPDHSTISDFRKTNAKALQEIFRQFNLLCLQLGLFGKELVAIDGTFIKAVNSKSKSFTKTKITKLIETIDRAVETYLKQLNEADAEESQAGKIKAQTLNEKIQNIKERRQQLELLLEQCESSSTGQVSLTDPESRQLRKGGKHTVGYNVQIAVDDKNHLAASCEVTQDPTDKHQLHPMSQQAKADLGLAENAPLDLLADTGYDCSAQLSACQTDHTRTYVPLQKTRPAGEAVYTDEDFVYDTKHDCYRCPQGKTLARKADDLRANGNGYRVYYDAAQCRDCPMLGQCTKGAYRKFKVSIHKDAIEAVKQRLAASPQHYAKRRELAEHPFGTVKDWNGGKDLLCRGLELARAETRLSFWAYNFKRALKVVGINRLIEATRASEFGELSSMFGAELKSRPTWPQNFLKTFSGSPNRLCSISTRILGKHERFDFLNAIFRQPLKTWALCGRAFSPQFWLRQNLKFSSREERVLWP